MNWFTSIVDDGRLDWPRALLFALVIALAGTLIVIGVTSAGAFDPYNPTWEGTSDFRQQVSDDPAVESELVRDTSRYDDVEADGTVAFVVAPMERYGDEDADRIRVFVEAGGTLVVLENFGTAGDELLADVGADARFDGQLVRDEGSYSGTPTMPVATGVEDHPRTVGVDRLSLNYATAVEPGNATVLVTTSEFAHLTDPADDPGAATAVDDGLVPGEDVDAEGATPADADIDPDAELDRHPVATVEDVGDGRVIVVGDPSVAINAMLEAEDNAVFLGNTYAGQQRVLLDVSHAEDVPPLVAGILTVRRYPLLQLLVGTVTIATVAAVSNRRLRRVLGTAMGRLSPTRLRKRGRWRGSSSAGPSGSDELLRAGSSPGLSTDERVAFLRRRHPEWDEERIKRVITAVNRTRVERVDE